MQKPNRYGDAYLLFIQDVMEITDTFNKSDEKPRQPQKVAIKERKQINLRIPYPKNQRK